MRVLDLTSSSRKDMTTASDRAAFEIIEDALSDRYRILACTRGKGMSGLYEAEDVVLRRKVALVHNSRSRSTIVLYSRIRGSP